jgi:hypothetical protein
MASAHPPPYRPDRPPGPPPAPRDDDDPDVPSLLKENARLRDLVVQLSRLVIKRVVERK